MIHTSKTAITIDMADILNFKAAVLLQTQLGIIIALFPKNALGNYSTGVYEAAFTIFCLSQLVIYGSSQEQVSKTVGT